MPKGKPQAYAALDGKKWSGQVNREQIVILSVQILLLMPVDIER
jgi:hypothetical protein